MKRPVLSKKLFPFIWGFVKEQFWSFFFLFFLSTAWAVDSTVWPYLLKQMIDIFSQYDQERALAIPLLQNYLLYAILLWVVIEICFRSRDFIRAYAFPKLEMKVRMAIFDHIQRHSPQYFNDHFSGNLSNKVNDITSQVTMILRNMMLFFPSFATCVLSVGFFYKVSPFFALILTVWIVCHFGVCLAFTPRCVKHSNHHAEARSELAGKIVDSLTNNFAVNLFYRFQYEKTKILRFQQEEHSRNKKASLNVASMFVCLSILFILGGISLNGLMISFWLKEKVTTGQVIQIFNTTWNVIFIIWFAGEMIPQFFQSIGVASQALSVLEDPCDITDILNAKPINVSKGEIVFDNVCFQYGNKHLFRNKNVHIQGGEKVGLVGYSGAGKSTFINLILRLYKLDEGRILIDGQDISQMTLESVRKNISLIPQDPILFHRTIFENIHYANLEASVEDVMFAAKLAHCDKFIDKLTDGIHSEVGERGSKLSGGERQRIAIARAFLKNSPILILDEATSALDSVTEKYIQQSLDHLMQNRTTIVIAHRFSTLSKMDKILVLTDGKIIEQGTHSELLSKTSFYSKMWHLQANPSNKDLENLTAPV